MCKYCDGSETLGEVKPLTVEQLRHMDGKPVYLMVLNNENVREAYRAFSDNVFFVGDGFARLSSKENIFIPLDEHYGVNLFAYDREPEGEAE